jgi:excisionase family DNA binding protein
MRQEPQYYSVEEAARILGVDEETIRRWIRQDKIPGVKRFGREYRIPRTSIDPEPPAQQEEKNRQGKGAD